LLQDAILLWLQLAARGLAQSADVSATPFGLGALGGLSGLSSLGLGSANFMDLQQKMMREVVILVIVQSDGIYVMQGDFEGFCFTGVTHCTDEGEIWHRGVDLWLCAKFTPLMQGLGYGTHKTENFTKFWNINTVHSCITCAIIMKFAEFVDCFKLRQVLKFGWNR